MGRVDRLMKEALSLPRQERRRLVARLRESLEGRPTKTAARQAASYQALIGLAGTVSSSFTDVSADKQKHLGAFELSESDEKALRMAIREGDRDDVVPAAKVLRRLSR